MRWGIGLTCLMRWRRMSTPQSATADSSPLKGSLKYRKGHRSFGVLIFLPFGGDTVEEAGEEGDLLGGAAGEERDQPPNGGAGDTAEHVGAEVGKLGIGIGEDEHLTLAGAEPLLADVKLPADVCDGAVAGD